MTSTVLKKAVLSMAVLEKLVPKKQRKSSSDTSLTLTSLKTGRNSVGTLASSPFRGPSHNVKRYEISVSFLRILFWFCFLTHNRRSRRYMSTSTNSSIRSGRASPRLGSLVKRNWPSTVTEGRRESSQGNTQKREARLLACFITFIRGQFLDRSSDKL
jgi:hypothetical protein